MLKRERQAAEMLLVSEAEGEAAAVQSPGRGRVCCPVLVAGTQGALLPSGRGFLRSLGTHTEHVPHTS